MPTIGKTYAIGHKGDLYSYDHFTTTWTTVPGILQAANVVKVNPYDYDHIVMGGALSGLPKIQCSFDGGVTRTTPGGDWATVTNLIVAFSFTGNNNIIYGICGSGTKVIKSTDGGLTFNGLPSSATLPFSNPGLANYGECIHFTNSLVGVIGVGANAFKTIDGGATWISLFGGAPIDPVNPTLPVLGIHISADGNTIIAITRTSVFRSTDAGVSFTNVFTFGTVGSIVPLIVASPIPTLSFIYGIDNYFTITNRTDPFYVSNNAGASWTAASGYTPVAVSGDSSLYQIVKGFYVATNNVYEFEETSPGVYSNTISFSITPDTEFPSITSAVQITPCYTLTPCAPEGSIITVSNDFSVYADEYVQIDGSCFLVTESLDCISAIPITYTSIQTIDNCMDCSPPTPEIIYGLEDCSNQFPTIYTTEALTTGISGYVGDVLYIQGYPNSCWTVIIEDGTTQAITVLNNYSTCPECIGEVPIPLPPPVYELENCVTEDILYTLNSQFAQAVDQVVNLVGYPGECWSVTELVFNNQSTANESIAVNTQGTLAIYENCPCCLPPVPPEPIKYTRVIPKPDRKFYQITQAQCDIQANIRFADNYHRLFKMLKYGINSMCDNVNLDRVWIKKMQSDLAVINDPTACIITTPVKPDVCPEPTGNPYIPPVPPVTYSFWVGGIGADGAFNCTQCFDGSNPGLFGLCPVFNMVLNYNILDTIDPDATYVFSYNGGCVFTLGSGVHAGSLPNLETYTLTSADITNAGVGAEDPCASCQG
jgi:hypothetical protein